MSAYLMLFLMLSLELLNTALNKQFQQKMQMDLVHYTAFIFLNSLFAVIVYLIINQFVIDMNGITFLFSVVYALVVLLCLIMGIFVLKYGTVANSTIISNAGGIIVSSLFGFAVLGEKLKLGAIIAIFLVIIGIIVPYSGYKKEKTGPKTFIMYVVWFFISGLANIINKIYTLTPGVCKSSQWFLMTNVLLLICAKVVLVFFLIKNPELRGTIMKPFSADMCCNIGIRTIMSNIASLLSVAILGLIDISVYSVLNSSLSLIGASMLSVFLFKEKIGIRGVISLILVIAAIIVRVL